MNQKKKYSFIDQQLLWEYDLTSFNMDKSYKIVIERVLILGDIQEWRDILQYYGKDKILEVIEWSRQLEARDKEFSRLVIHSDLLHAA